MSEPDNRPQPKPDWKLIAYVAGTGLAFLVSIFVNDTIQIATKHTDAISDLRASDVQLVERAASFGSRLTRVEALQDSLISSMGRETAHSAAEDDRPAPRGDRDHMTQ